MRNYFSTVLIKSVNQMNQFLLMVKKASLKLYALTFGTLSFVTFF